MVSGWRLIEMEILLNHKKMKKRQKRRDYEPKNHPSKSVTYRCPSIKISWLQRHCTTWSHKPVRNGHTMVSGIVRQKIKEETREEIRFANEEKA